MAESIGDLLHLVVGEVTDDGPKATFVTCMPTITVEHTTGSAVWMTPKGRAEGVDGHWVELWYDRWVDDQSAGWIVERYRGPRFGPVTPEQEARLGFTPRTGMLCSDGRWGPMNPTFARFPSLDPPPVCDRELCSYYESEMNDGTQE